MASPPPIGTPIFDRNGLVTKPWAAFFRDMFNRSGGSSETTLADHLSDATDAHNASAISFAPTGSIAAVNVQTAIAEVSSDVDAINAALPGLEGDSAYQVAVSNGFVGTEAEWLDSLVGPTGATGATGSIGPEGATGPQGPTGPPGGAVDTSFVVSSLDGYIYTDSLSGNAYLLS